MTATPIRPPFTRETALAKVQAAEDAWNSGDPDRVVLAYTVDTEWRNRAAEIIPRGVIERAPSAELKPGQVDQDSLPPYEVLDAILYRFIDLEQSQAEIINQGFDAATVERVAKLVFRSEYKRRQAAPGPKVSRRAFGRERRYPICSGWG